MKKLAIFNKYQGKVENRLNGKRYKLQESFELHNHLMHIVTENCNPVTTCIYFDCNGVLLPCGVISQGNSDYKQSAKYKQLLSMQKDIIEGCFNLNVNDYLKSKGA